ncbi:MAG TPA: SigE family RNA polymerase sigma factor [Dermatophilaceae bacterium]
MRASKAERDAAFATFMDQTGPALLRTAWFLTGDTDRAQELTQAAFVKTYVVWHRIDQDRALAYARRCLVNHKIDVWRATRHQVVADLTSVGFELGSTSQSQLQSQSRDGAVATADHRDDLVRRLSRLPEQQRKVVVLRYYADQSEASVAEALGISVGSVKSAASRGLAALRQQAEAGPKPRSRPLPAWTHSPNATPFTEGSLR